MEKINIELLTDGKRKLWDDFVDDSNNGTIFHKQKFLSYHKDKFKVNEHSLLFYQGKKLISVLPLAIFESEGKKVAKSPYGASFGGFVYNKVTYSNVSKIIRTFKEYAIENNFAQIIITLPPLIYHKKFETYQDFCLLKENFKLTNRDLTNIISLQNFKPENIFKEYRSSCVSEVQKAVKSGINFVEEGNVIKPFHDILCETLNAHSARPTHDYEELCLLKNLFPEKIIQFSAYLKDEITGGALGIIANKSVLLYFYVCVKKEYLRFGINNLLYHNCISWAAKKGFKFFDTGTSSMNMVPKEGLLFFKENFGGTAIFRDTYTLGL